MASEQRVSASVFSHRGDAYDANTNNFILDGRQLFGFESDNSHVSIEEKSRDFFFAVCDTKPTDNLNTSVSGIRELKKIYLQFREEARDIKSRTELLGECFIDTEGLLYDSGSFAAPSRGGARGPKLDSLDKRLPDYGEGGGERDEDGYGAPGADGEYGDPAGDGGAEGDGEDGRYSGEPDEGDDAYAGDDGYSDGDSDGYGDDSGDGMADRVVAPGEKGFSTVGFILSEKKGSILAQGECEAFLLRSGALRVLSGGGGKKAGASLGRASAAGSPSPASAQRQVAARGYTGRASEIFEPREGDVYLLCTSSVIDAIGEENIDNFLAMRDDISAICGSLMSEAAKNDPASNMTCMLVRIEENHEEEAIVSPLHRRPEFSYGAGGGAAGLAGRSTPGLGGQQQQQQPEYQDQDGRDTRVAMRGAAPYQNSGAFTKRAPTRFEPPPQRRLSFAGKKSLVTSVATTVVLILALFVVYLLWVAGNNNDNPSSGRLPTATPRSEITTSAPGEDGATEEYGDDDDDAGDGWEITTTFAEFTTTETTTTETTTTTPEIVMYTVKSGDTLSKIAENYYSNSKLYSLIKEANGLTSDNITIGQQLIIPPKPEPTTAAAALSASEQDGGAAAVNGTVSRQSTQ